MSKKRHHSPEYSYYPETLSGLSSVYYDLQEYDLLQRVVEVGAGQFTDDTVKSDIDFAAFTEFHGVRQGIERPQLLLVRKALQELKIMESIDYADCYTVMRGVRIAPFNTEAYGPSFKFAFKQLDMTQFDQQ